MAAADARGLSWRLRGGNQVRQRPHISRQIRWKIIPQLARDVLCATYLDAVVVDTPVLDKDLRDYIPDAHSLAERVERAFVFREYLDRSWNALAVAELPLDWPEKSAHACALLTRLSRNGSPGGANYGPLFTRSEPSEEPGA